MQSKAHGTGLTFDTCQGKKYDRFVKSGPFIWEWFMFALSLYVSVKWMKDADRPTEARQVKRTWKDIQWLGKHRGMPINLYKTLKLSIAAKDLKRN